MNKIISRVAILAISAIPAIAAADTSSGSLTVTGTIESSISLTVESAGGTTSGTGTAAATSALGSFAKFGSTPDGFSKARGASNWTLSSSIGVKVLKANSTSDNYTLTAQLGSAPATGVGWKLNNTLLSDSAATTLTEEGEYGATGSYAWDIVIADSATAETMDNTINFTATSN